MILKLAFLEKSNRQLPRGGELPVQIYGAVRSQLGQGLADGIGDHQIRRQVPGHRGLVDQH